MKKQYFVHSNVHHCNNTQSYTMSSIIDAEVGETAEQTFDNITQEIYKSFEVREVTIVIKSIQLLN